jgi:hypothetical protein
MCRKEEVLRPWDPLYLSDWCSINDAVLVQAGVSLRCSFPPDNLASREAHYHINVVRALGDLVYIVA